MYFKPTNIKEDMELRDQVIENEKDAVQGFLDNFSKPILQFVGQYIKKVQPIDVYSFERKAYYKDYAIPITGEYYMFIAAKFPGEEKDGEAHIPAPQWNVLRYYSAANDSRLYNYVNIITIRHFKKLAIQSDKSDEIHSLEEKDVFDFLAKIYYDQDFSYEDLSQDIMKDLYTALNDLRCISSKEKNIGNIGNFKFDGEKDYQVLKLCIMYDYEWNDIAEKLKEYFPAPFPHSLKDLPDKDKKMIQTRIAQWKKRAINHFTNLIYRSDKYKYLKSAISKHRTNKKINYKQNEKHYKR